MLQCPAALHTAPAELVLLLVGASRALLWATLKLGTASSPKGRPLGERLLLGSLVMAPSALPLRYPPTWPTDGSIACARCAARLTPPCLGLSCARPDCSGITAYFGCGGAEAKTVRPLGTLDGERTVKERFARFGIAVNMLRLRPAQLLSGSVRIRMR